MIRFATDCGVCEDVCADRVNFEASEDPVADWGDDEGCLFGPFTQDGVDCWVLRVSVHVEAS